MAEDLAVKVAGIDQRSKSNTHRLDKVEDRQDNLDKLVTSLTVLATEQKHIRDDIADVTADVKAVTADVKAINAKAGKHWETVVEKVVLLLVAAIVGFFLTRLGL